MYLLYSFSFQEQPMVANLQNEFPYRTDYHCSQPCFTLSINQCLGLQVISCTKMQMLSIFFFQPVCFCGIFSQLFTKYFFRLLLFCWKLYALSIFSLIYLSFCFGNAATELVTRSIRVMMESGCEEVCQHVNGPSSFASLTFRKRKR